MNRHPDTLRSKSKTHTVTKAAEGVYTVLSGYSGNEYTVTLLEHGGASCTCDWSTKRHNIVNCACSHTLAVFETIESEKQRSIKIHTDYDTARRQHRPIINLMDGIILTTRKG